MTNHTRDASEPLNEASAKLRDGAQADVRPSDERTTSDDIFWNRHGKQFFERKVMLDPIDPAQEYATLGPDRFEPVMPVLTLRPSDSIGRLSRMAGLRRRFLTIADVPAIHDRMMLDRVLELEDELPQIGASVAAQVIARQPRVASEPPRNTSHEQERRQKQEARRAGKTAAKTQQITEARQARAGAADADPVGRG